MMRLSFFLPALLLPLLLFSLARGEQDISPAQLDFFETNVRPNLIKYCYECHSVEGGESRGGLYLDTREGMLEGGSTGPVFDEEKWEYSLFVDAVTWGDPDFEMPPKNKMPDDVIKVLVQWVEMGAPDPRERKTTIVESEIDIEAGKEHWAYQKPVRPAAKSIDELTGASRKAQELVSVGPADAQTLLRRFSFDITGLPPTPPEVRAFAVAHKTDPEAAIAKKVASLLASEAYGERWGRHWLDVVRYGESSGTMNVVYPYAWRFRNYVIDSFNDDKPYNHLITEHLAGDLLPFENEEERQENLIATGFLAVGPKKQNEKNQRVFTMNLIDEQIDTITRGFIGTTASCARCHDHKFDPIPTTDYYAMAGIFESTETLWGTIAGNQNHRTSELLELPISDAHVTSEDQKALYEQKLAFFEEVRERFQKGRRGVRPEEGFDNKAHIRTKQQFMRLRDELNFINPDGTSKTFGMGAREAEITKGQVLVAGDLNQPAQEVNRGFLQVLNFDDAPTIPEGASGRLQLAEWITSTNHPLTARVMVNRVWMHLTGSPIVETMDNFGTSGLPPSNPELLDFLAIRFMENGWSIKKIISEIVLSDTYQLASTFHKGNYAKDPDNLTNWRANPRQLDAEALRDQMLLVSGLLERERPEGSMAQKIGNARLGGAKKDARESFNTAHFTGRSLYLPVLRDALPDELGLFDFPDPQSTIAKRATTNVAPQSLHLMNSELVQRQAFAMAEVLERNFSSPKDKVSNAFLLSYSRFPTKEEVSQGIQFLRSFDPGDAPAAETSAASSARPRRGMEAGTMTEESEDPPTMSKGKGKGGKGGKGKEKDKARSPGESPDPPFNPATREQVILTAFCQALMMSAEFRMTH